MRKQAIEIPRITDSKEYVLADAKLTELRQQLTEAESKKDSVLLDLNAPRVVHDPIKDAAERMLAGEANAVTPAMTKQLWESFQELLTRIRVIQTAIRMQEQTVKSLRAALANDASIRVASIHRENVRNVVAKLKELDAAMVEEHALRDELFQRDLYEVSIVRPMGIGGLGMLNDTSSRASRYLMEAFEHGFIELSELPKKLQAMVPPPAKPKLAISAIAEKFDGWVGA